MKINRIEFDDPDDPESGCHPDAPIKIRIAPEGMARLLTNASRLTSEDQKALGQMLRLAYAQGRHVERLVRENREGQP